MTRKEAAKNVQNMREYKRKVTSSQAAAIKALKDAGILTDEGRPANPYKELLKDKSTCDV
ncbi:hypothetical protein [uncultured Thiocystis sp.]|jgi:hypothetical protein|uniref:hypothetical protein n=1 Tax=uncultured Thiocystis sp. TaxID=1202134 RepID=UPI0025DF1B25|nr:hypothetical protein [uncultured Thiocystis sp.]